MSALTPPDYPPQGSKPKNQGGGLTLSDDDEPTTGFFTPETSAEDGSRRTTTTVSPWQRMKWTDNMVRLLIMIVFYTGDEATGPEGSDPGKKKGGPVGVLQKKGKWKSVSRAMMERGFYVSPQQCEDKFNDLNKRYKRVNDILGKGTACRVVENQGLLDSMDHLSPKAKEEVRKLLNSKHLFFREMCAYHNSCGEAQRVSENVPNSSREESEGSKLGKGNEDYDEELEEGEDDVDSEDNEDDDRDEDDEVDGKKRKRGGTVSPWIRQTGEEVMGVMQDAGKSATEKIGWMKVRVVQLEEQKVGLSEKGLELEKQRLKWIKYSGKKEREMERERLGNERLRVENERMILLIKQKEMELLHHHKQQHQ